MSLKDIPENFDESQHCENQKFEQIWRVPTENNKSRTHLQYGQRHTMINHCDRHITHLSGTDIYFLFCYIHVDLQKIILCLVLLSITNNAQESK